MRIWLTVTFITCFELYLKANDGHFDVTYGPGPDGSLRVSLTCRLTPDGVTTKRTTGVDIILVHDVHPDGPYQFDARFGNKNDATLPARGPTHALPG